MTFVDSQLERGTDRLPPAVINALVDFDDIAMKRFEIDFETLAGDTDRNRAAARMRHLVGVALKKDYSDEKRITNRQGALVDFKWSINATNLDNMSKEAWQIQLLEGSPDRLPSETGKQVATRLRRETILQRCYFTIIHPYLCQTPKVRREIRSVLKEFGLGEFAPLASSKGLLGAGAAKLYAILIVAAPSLPAGAIAVTALALCVIGVNRICRNARTRRS